MERRLTAYFVLLLILLFGSLAVAEEVTTDGDEFFGEQVVSQHLQTSADAIPDDNYKDGEQVKIWGTWTVTENTDNSTEILDQDTKELTPDATGTVHFDKKFNREFSEIGNYTYTVAIYESTQQYNMLDEEWETEVEELDKTQYEFTVEEPDLLSLVAPQNLAQTMSMM